VPVEKAAKFAQKRRFPSAQKMVKQCLNTFYAHPYKKSKVPKNTIDNPLKFFYICQQSIQNKEEFSFSL